MATEAEVIQFLRASPRDWNGLCQALMWRLCEAFGVPAAPSPGSATAARLRSHIVSTDASRAPGGTFHYWSGIPDGHVALGLGGGRVVMGSANVQQRYGINAGITTVDTYTRATGLRYEGWSDTNANGHIRWSAPAAAGGTASPISNITGSPIRKRKTMFRIYYEAGGSRRIMIIGVDGREAHITTLDHVALLRRLEEGHPAMQFLPAEKAIVADYLRKVNG